MEVICNLHQIGIPNNMGIPMKLYDFDENEPVPSPMFSELRAAHPIADG